MLLKVHSWPPVGGVVILFETGNPFNLYRIFLHVNIVKVQLWPPLWGVVIYLRQAIHLIPIALFSMWILLRNSFALDPLFPATNLSYRSWRFNWYWYLNSTFLIDQRFKFYYPAKPRSIGWPDEKQKLAKRMSSTSFRSSKVGQLLMIFVVFF